MCSLKAPEQNVRELLSYLKAQLLKISFKITYGAHLNARCLFYIKFKSAYAE